MPKISVVIPLYNKAPSIKASIDSVLNQTYDDYEVIIVDDGSTDNSVEVIRSNFNSEKIRLFQKENGGPSSARNRGVKEAKGEWIVLLDADDYLLPSALRYFMHLIEETRELDINYIVCNYYIKYKDVVMLFSKARNKGVVKNPFYLEATRDLTERPGSAIIRRELLLRHPYKEFLRRYEDAECQYEMMRENPIYISPIPVMISDRDSTDAAGFRKDISEDFIGHLKFEGKGYWEQMSLFLLALECKQGYPDYAHKLFSKEYHRIDLVLGSFYLWIRNKIVTFWRDMLYPTERYSINNLLDCHKCKYEK